MTSIQDNINKTTKCLENGRLKVEMGLPGKYYGNSRFDWTGFIRQVTLDEKHSFCTTESPISGVGSGGEGICNEYGIREPIGYDEIETGEEFPKLGVGILKKEDKGQYDFMHFYKITPFEIAEDWKADRVTFISQAKDCRGYSVQCEKIIKLEDSSLIVEYKLTNCGTKAIDTTEYCHNFLKINGHEIGPKYVLTLPEIAEVKTESEILQVEGNRIMFKYTQKPDFYALIDTPWTEVDKGWELVHQDCAAGVRETISFLPQKLAVWGNSHVISPEAFIHIKVGPGEVLQWSRKFDFFYK